MLQKVYTVACGTKLWLRIVPADRSIEMLNLINIEYIRSKISIKLY